MRQAAVYSGWATTRAENGLVRASAIEQRVNGSGGSAAVQTTRYAFLTLPDYSQIALTTAVEPLRMANRVSGEIAYEWLIVTLDGQPAVASSGLMLTPTLKLADLGPV